MTEISRPWNGVVTGDSGPYSDQMWHASWRNAFGFGASFINAGPVKGNDDGTHDSLFVYADNPASANVLVAPGSALVRGIFYLNDAAVTMPIGANASGNARIDTIVLQADYTAQTVRLVVREGTPAASPVPPTLTQNDGVLWEIPLADVAVANGFVSINQGNITPNAHYANLGDGVYLDRILNNSAIVLETGHVVVLDTTADRAATTTTTINTAILGVWMGRTDIGDAGRVITRGIAYVRTTGAVTRGQYLKTSTTDGQAIAVTAGSNIFARALETTTGAGLCLALIDVRFATVGSYAVLQHQEATNTNGGNVAQTTWTTRTLNTEVVDADGIVSIAANQFTPIAGTYKLRADCAAFLTAGTIRHRLYNVTAAAVVAGSVSVQGRLGNAGSATGDVLPLAITFTANGTDAYAIQYYSTVSQATNGLGVAINEAGQVEVYMSVHLEKIG